MGRYYSGDIEGKFWFAVQPSNDAEQFGAQESDPAYINYYADDADEAKERIKEIINKLGLRQDFIEIDPRNSEGSEAFFKAYHERGERRAEEEDKLWASLELGLKIYHCILEEGGCSFDAEI